MHVRTRTGEICGTTCELSGTRATPISRNRCATPDMRSVSPKGATCCESVNHSTGWSGGSGREWQHISVEGLYPQTRMARLKCNFTRPGPGSAASSSAGPTLGAGPPRTSPLDPLARLGSSQFGSKLVANFAVFAGFPGSSWQ